MTLLRLTLRLLQARLTRHLLTAVIVALGAGLMLGAVAVGDAARSATSALVQRFPLVAGGEVGAVSLVLGSLTRLQDLGPGVDAALLQRLEADPRVAQVVPLLGGHAVSGYPLLATSPAYLEPRARFPLSAGRVFQEGAMEAVLGREAALGLAAELGNELDLEHQHAGPAGGGDRLKVVGILERTGTDADRTVFCPLGAIFHSHEHGASSQAEHEHGHGHGHAGRRVSALLVRPVDDRALLAVQEELDALPGVEVALTGQTLGRIAEQLATGTRLVRALVVGVVLLVFLALLLSMYGSALTEARDVALIRVLGARRATVAGVMLLAVLVVLLVGAAGGLLVGGVLGGVAETLLRDELGLEATVSVLSWPVAGYLAAMVGLLAVAGAVPALAAYSVQAADALAEVPGAGSAGRRYLGRVVRLLAVLFVAVWMAQSSIRPPGFRSPAIDARSAELFGRLAAASEQAARELDGQRVELEGYMYALGDPFTVQDFYLVGLNPRLPRCPFCYRAPNSQERIRISTGGRSFDLCKGPVRVSGVLHADLDADDPYRLVLASLTVVIP